MQVEHVETITGNERTVRLSIEYKPGTRRPCAYAVAVMYHDQPHLDFVERRTTKVAAKRTFSCWSRLVH